MLNVDSMLYRVVFELRRKHTCPNCNGFLWQKRLYERVKGVYRGVGWLCKLCGHVDLDKEHLSKNGI